jgi:glycosyltransferase involved in cell wall biosynthesis
MPEEEESEIHAAVNELGIDVWLSPLLILDPLTLDIPSLYCVPDLQHEYYPEFFSPDVMAWRNRYFSRSAETADGILTISNYSKRTIIEKYGVPDDKVYVTWLDCPTYFTLEKAMEHEVYVAEHYDLPEEFILFPANTWEHKNHLTLLKSLEYYTAAYGEAPVLVLTGYESDAHINVVNAIRGSSLSHKVRFLGYVPEDLMPAIYHNATCLVFPSMYEGFGIPLVEAMRTDCPIIAANNTTMKEIAGDAALYFNTMDEIELAVLIKFVIEIEELREFLIEKGRQRASLFSFEKCVTQTLDVIDRVCGDFYENQDKTARARDLEA